MDAVLNEAALSLIEQSNPGEFAVYQLSGGRLLTYFASDTLPGISGMEKAEYDALTREDAAAVVFERDRPRVAQTLAGILVDRKDVDLTYRILHKTRGFVWVHAKARWLGTLDGRPILMTQFHNTSSEAEEHEYLLNHTTTAIYVTDLETRELLFANDAALSGWGRGSYAGKSCREYLCGGTADCDWCPLGKLENGEAHTDSRYLEPFGRWYRIEAREMRWYGRPAAALYYVDITRRIERQESLRGDRDTLETILASIPGGVCIFSEKDGSVRLDYTNDGFFSTHRGSRAFWAPQLLKNTVDWLFEPDRALFWSEFSRVRDGSKPEGTVCYRVRGEDGNPHWIRNQFRPAYERGGARYYYSCVTCIDDQKEAEEHLEESQGALREAIANSDIQFFTYFPGRHRCEIYAPSTRLSQLPCIWENYPDDFLAYTKCSAEDAEAYREMLRQIDRGEDTSECTVRFRYEDVWNWEKMTLRAVRGRDGTTVRAQGHSINVTELRRAEERLERERLRLRQLGGNLVEAFSFNVTTSGSPTLCSSDPIRYGETIRQEVADDAARLAPPVNGADTPSRGVLLSVANQIPGAEDRARFLKTCGCAGIREAAAEGRFSQTIRYRRYLGGQLRWVSTAVEILPDPESGDLVAFFYTSDVHNETLYREVCDRIIGRSCAALAFWDLSDRLLHLRYAGSPADEILKSHPYSEAIAEGIGLYAAKDEAPELLQKLSGESVLAGLEDKDVYTVYFQGTDRCASLPGNPERRFKSDCFYLSPERSVVVMLLTDVTEIFEQERDNREKMAAALAAAEQASVAKTEFLSRMSHEIRTPMNAIIGLDAIAMQEPGLSAGMEDHLQKIGISAHFLLSLINDILDMSRIESGRMALTLEPFNFEEMISGINTILYEQCRDSGLEYECVLKSWTEEVYVGDRTKLQQVLVNILGNAVKFTPRGGRIHFLIEQLARSGDTARLRFEISDTGIGIDESFAPHLFEAFSQENRGRTSAYGGTGLGLAISRNLVSLMGGEIRVHSIKNVGSVFTVEVELGLSEQSRRRAQRVASLRPLFTLIVDDDAVVCRHTQKVLSDAGLRAEWVDSGALAVEKVRAQNAANEDFDLILLDWKMPDMDGVETARRIRGIVGPEVTIIIMSAYDWMDIEQKAREAGVDLFMKKPVFASSVVHAFEHVFLGREAKEEPAKEPDIDFSGCRFLVAEDNEINAEITRSLLEMKHGAVDTAANGAEALEAFSGTPVGYYDAILMDVRMPIMDGLEAARAIRAMKKADSRSVPILAMTANAFREDVEASLKSGMNAHLAKPIEPEALYEALGKVVRHHGE